MTAELSAGDRGGNMLNFLPGPVREPRRPLLVLAVAWLLTYPLSIALAGVDDVKAGHSGEGDPVVAAAPPFAAERAEVDAFRTYLQAWARSHGEEYRYLFGPAAFDRLASDMTQEFIIYRKRGS